MNALKYLNDAIIRTYGPFIPTSSKKRNEFLDRIREKVKFYQPKIEERTGIRLGKVKVKDNKEWFDDVMFEAFMEQLGRAVKNGRFPDKTDYFSAYLSSGLAEGILRFPIWLYNSMTGPEARYHNNTIYFPFNYMNRFLDSEFGVREKKSDCIVVHELSHSLWDKIGGESRVMPFNVGREWFEGFATYCTEDFFADFYPESQEMIETSGVYSKGKKKIKSLVEKYGKEIILEVPKRWEEFENNQT